MAKTLTQRGVESARPKRRRYGRPDGLVPGLQLVTQPTGAKTFRLLARINGRLVNLTIGSATVLKLAEARTKAKGILSEIAAGGDPRAARVEAARAESETVETVARRFIDKYAKVHTRTWRVTEWRIKREILPRWGKRPISSITKRDVATLLDGITDRGLGITANRVLSTARKMFSWARERDLIAVSPFDHIKPPAPEVSRDRVLDERELALVWRAAGNLPWPFGPFYQLAILTGQRRGETAGLRWSELDAGLTMWVLPPSRAKNGVEHRIPIVSQVAHLLNRAPRLSDFVFTVTGKSPISGFSEAKRALDAEIASLNGGAPIAPWRLHDTRRTFATGLAKLGVQLPVVERLLSHSGASFAGVAGVYQKHDFASEKKAALEAWAAHVVGLRP